MSNEAWGMWKIMDDTYHTRYCYAARFPVALRATPPNNCSDNSKQFGKQPAYIILKSGALFLDSVVLPGK